MFLVKVFCSVKEFAVKDFVLSKILFCHRLSSVKDSVVFTLCICAVLILDESLTRIILTRTNVFRSFALVMVYHCIAIYYMLYNEFLFDISLNSKVDISSHTNQSD